jgi:hypothetical protein
MLDLHNICTARKQEVRMKMRILAPVFAVMSVACSTSSYNTPASMPAPMDSASMAMSAKSQALHDAMRKLWADHVFYTRLYIISAVNGSDDAQATAARLLKNQEDIGNAIVPYYGAAAGQRLTDLLKQHILIAVDLVSAAKAGDQAKQNDADQRWHQNAADIATFLSGANPNWPRQAVLDMLNQHLALTTKEAVDRLQKNYADDIPNFDAIFSQATMMADTLAGGIVKQFPGQFS